LHYVFSCTGADLTSKTYTDGTTSSSTSCSYDDGPSDHTVTGKIIDKDEGSNAYSTSVHVNNVNPTGTLGNNGPINEGSSATVSFTGVVDPSTADAASLHYVFSCTGADLTSKTYTDGTTSSSTSCSYDDGPSDHTVTGKIIDKDEGSNAYSTSVHVNNVNPTVTPASAQSSNEGE